MDKLMKYAPLIVLLATLLGVYFQFQTWQQTKPKQGGCGCGGHADELEEQEQYDTLGRIMM